MRSSLIRAIAALDLPNLPTNVAIAPAQTPLTPDRAHARIRYRSSTAQRLVATCAPEVRSNAPAIATDIAAPDERIWPPPDIGGGELGAISVGSGGALDLAIRDRAVARWLAGVLARGPGEATPPNAASWPIDYALDRCASWAVAAEREGWFSLEADWLDGDGRLRLGLRAERTAIAALVRAGDRLDAARPPKVSERDKLAARLATDFEALHRHSRPWEAYHQGDRATATARRGLYCAYGVILRATLPPP